MKTLNFIKKTFMSMIVCAGIIACSKGESFDVVEINMTEAGGLRSVLGDEYMDATMLKISGPLNGDDIYYLREIFKSESCKISTLDLSYASIVDGGSAYYSNNTTEYYTEKNVIGTSMFRGCLFETVMLPMNAVSIEENAFYGCDNLIEVAISSGVTTIGDKAFLSCDNLTEVTIPNGVTSLGEKAFYTCASLTKIVIPGGVTSIKSETFNSCRKLAELTISEGVTKIENGAFINCKSLTEVTIPNTVTTIGTSAFSHCANLYKVTIGNKVKSIGSIGFNCDGLCEVYCYATTPPDISSNTFTHKVTSLYVPKGCSEAYEKKWGSKFSNIYEME